MEVISCDARGGVVLLDCGKTEICGGKVVSRLISGMMNGGDKYVMIFIKLCTNGFKCICDFAVKVSRFVKFF